MFPTLFNNNITVSEFPWQNPLKRIKKQKEDGRQEAQEEDIYNAKEEPPWEEERASRGTEAVQG